MDGMVRARPPASKRARVHAVARRERTDPRDRFAGVIDAIPAAPRMHKTIRVPTKRTSLGRRSLKPPLGFSDRGKPTVMAIIIAHMFPVFSFVRKSS